MLALADQATAVARRACGATHAHLRENFVHLAGKSNRYHLTCRGAAARHIRVVNSKLSKAATGFNFHQMMLELRNAAPRDFFASEQLESEARLS